MVKISKVIDDVHLSAFTEKVSSHADGLYRFSYSALLDMEVAYEVVKGVVEFAAAQIDKIHFQPDEEVKDLIYKECWKLTKGRKVNASNQTLTSQLGDLAKIEIEARAMLVLTDVIGFDASKAADVLAIDQNSGQANLIKARKALVG